MNNIFKKYPFLSIVLFYLLGNFTLLINNGIYWDDWAIYNSTYEAIMTQFNGNGSPLFGYMHLFLLQSKYAVFMYHLLTVILQILTGYALWNSLKLLKANPDFSYWIVLIFTIVPYFSAKNTLICFPYTLTYYLFIFATYLMIKAVKTNNLVLRFLALLLFFSSFLTNSLVVFYLVPYILLYLIVNKQVLNEIPLNFKSIIKLVKLPNIIKTSDFLVLPFVFFIVKLFFFKTSGLYAESGYNNLYFSRILKVPTYLIATIQESFFGLFSKSLSVLYNNVGFLYILIVIIFVVYRILKKLDLKEITHSTKETNLYIVLGFLLFLLATLPYALVGKSPSFEAYDTRHQLLLPIGAAFLVVGLVFKLIRKEYFQKTMIGIVSLFIILNLSLNFQFIKGWLKQESIYENIKDNTLILENNSFIVVDTTVELNATSRDNAFYSLSGIAKKAFGNQKRLLCEYDEYFSLRSEWNILLKEAEKFNLKDYHFSEPNYIIKIDKGSFHLTNLNALKLVAFKLFAKEKYEEGVKNILTIKVENKEINTIQFFLKNK